jgi:hypothetical protein
VEPAEPMRRICGVGLAEKVPLRLPLSLPGDFRRIPPLPVIPIPNRLLGVVAAEVGVRLLLLLRALFGRGVYRGGMHRDGKRS